MDRELRQADTFGTLRRRYSERLILAVGVCPGENAMCFDRMALWRGTAAPSRDFRAQVRRNQARRMSRYVTAENVRQTSPAVSRDDVRSARNLVVDRGMQDDLNVLRFPTLRKGLCQFRNGLWIRDELSSSTSS